MEKRYEIVRNRFVRLGIVIGVMFCLIWMGAGPYPHLVNDGPSWHIVWEGSFGQAAEADLGSGVGGILEIFFANHSAAPATCYDENDSSVIEGWCDTAGLGYANADDFNVELAHSTTFDVVIRVRGNKTQCWRSDKFYDTDLRVRWTSADLSVGGDTEMTGVVSQNDSGIDFLYMNFYDDNSGSGYSLSKDASADITSIKFEAYY